MAGNWMRSVAANGSLLVLSTLLVLLVGEGVVRLFAPQQLIMRRPDIWKPHEELGWVHREDVSTTMNTGAGEVRLLTDAQGFRVGRQGRVEAEKVILLLGDSFMEALQVEYSSSVAGRLERHLSSELSEGVAVRNTAVGGWDPSHYLKQADLLLDSEGKYDLVLTFVYLGNDVVSQRRDRIPPRTPTEVHRFRLPRSASFDEFVDAFLYPINDVLETRSHLFVLAKTQADVLLMRLGLTAAYFPRVLMNDEAHSPGWSVSAEILADLYRLARSKNVPSLFVLLPAPVQVERDTYRDYVVGFDIDTTNVDLGQPNRLLGAELKRRGVPYMDVLPALLDAADRGIELYGSVDRHFTAAGHEVVERTIRPHVLRLVSVPLESAGDSEGSALQELLGR